MELPEILAEQREFLQASLRPSVEISFELRDTLPWESKLGGCPYLEAAADYPRDAQGRPMLFLAQLNLDDVCGIMFGDAGNCNFFIAKEDLRNCDFSNVEYDWQCC